MALKIDWLMLCPPPPRGHFWLRNGSQIARGGIRVKGLGMKETEPLSYTHSVGMAVVGKRNRMLARRRAELKSEIMEILLGQEERKQLSGRD